LNIMIRWKSSIDLEAPCWDGYRGFLDALPGDFFPGAGSLERLLPPRTSSRNGSAIRFVSAVDLPGVDYERHIFETGQVSTRENSWHDLFNALVWCRLPRLKAAMNGLHYENLDDDQGGGRGRLRDALTLLDESGVIVSGPGIDALNALARGDWNAAFSTHREGWGTNLQVLVCGHAILEKFLNPYKSITAHALLLHTPGPCCPEEIDRALGAALAIPGWLSAPSCLSPLPLTGIPGWWREGDQDAEFYQDHQVFRPFSPDRLPAPVHFLAEMSPSPDPEHMENQSLAPK
jgi:hypothetical protein